MSSRSSSVRSVQSDLWMFTSVLDGGYIAQQPPLFRIIGFGRTEDCGCSHDLRCWDVISLLSRALALDSSLMQCPRVLHVLCRIYLACLAYWQTRF